VKLAVRLEERRRVEVDGQRACAVRANLVHADVARARYGPKELQAPKRPSVLDRDDIQ
jgi:hypothetical protein